MAAEPGPSGWRNSDIAAIGRSEGGPAVLREWIGTWTQAMVPHSTAKLWTAATIAPLDCGPKKPEPGQQMQQPCPRKLRPIALAEVLMKLAESCVIEQHIERLLKEVEPTNLGLGSPDAAALIVRLVRGWANDMAVAPKLEQDADVVLPIDLENAYGRAYRSTCLEAARAACPQLAAICAAQCEPCDTKFWQRCDDGWTVDSTTRGGWQGSRAMQVMFVLGLEFVLSKADDLAMGEFTRIGLQDDMTFIGSAAAIDRSWGDIERALADARHRLCGYKCGVWAPGFEQFEDTWLPLSVRRLCLRIPRKRHGVSLFGSEANAQHCVQVELGQAPEAPTQAKERLEKALTMLHNIERFACDQHDYVSFAKAWMLMSKEVAHALDYDLRIVPPGVMAPLQRRLEAGLRQTMSVLLGSEVSELAWERAKLPTCYGGLGLRVAQMGFAAQATYWSAVDMHRTVMPRICEALNRPIREPHPDVASAMAAKVDLLLSGVAVDTHATVAIEIEAGKLYDSSPWVVDRRAAEIIRPAPVQTDERVPPKSLARDMAFAKHYNREFCRLLKRSKRPSCMQSCHLNSRPLC